MTTAAFHPAAPASSQAWIALIAGTLIVAASPILVRFTEVGPVASAAWRLAIAVPALWAWAAVAGAGATGGARRSRADSWMLVAAGAAFAGDLACYHAAVGLTSVANATFICNLAPALVVLLAWPLLGERPHGRTLAILAVAGAGVGLMAQDSAARPGASHLGDLWALGGAACFAGYLLLVARLRRRFDAATVMLWSSASGAAMLALLALARGETLLPAGLGGWSALLGLGLAVHVVGQGLTAAALGRLPVGGSSPVLLLQPAISALIAWPLLGEVPGWLQALGALLILAAVGSVRMPPRRTRAIIGR
ncbi:MAG: DMT family transporter [Alphaproteobacteria bacterium]|jgi:drug/metabolite transporter (DMT)-like permease|nr:DMT family transporter [Alphaproteobacteria bacterium]